MSESIQGCYLPASLPALSVLLMDYPDPSARRLSRYFGVSRSTAHRWLQEDRAPRAVLAALYLAGPRFGGAETYNKVLHAEYRESLHAALARSLRNEVESLRHELARVVSMADFGAANEPTLRASARRSALQVVHDIRSDDGRDDGHGNLLGQAHG